VSFNYLRINNLENCKKAE